MPVPRRARAWLPVSRLAALALLAVLTASACFVGIPDLASAPAPADGGVDVGTTPDSEGGTSPGCGAGAPAGASAFCDDFERDAVLGAWKNITADSASSVTLGTARAHSGARSAHFEVGASASASAGLQLDLVAGSMLTLDYWLFVDGAFPSRTLNVGTVSFHYAAGRSVEVFLALNGSTGQARLGQQERGVGPLNFHSVGAPAPLVRSRWVEVKVTVDQHAIPQRLTLVYDGTTLANAEVIQTSTTSTSSTATMGTVFATAGPATSFDIDDVTIIVDP